MNCSIQLWSLRHAGEVVGWDVAIARVADIGFTRVEPFAIHMMRAAFEPAIRRGQLRVPSVHGFLDSSLEPTLDAAQALGVRTVIHPHLEPHAWKDAAALEATAEMLTTASKAAAARGMTVAFHNHEVELLHEVEGTPAFWGLIDRLPAEVGVEFDIYWAAIAGIDIVSALLRLGDRALALHVKDGPFKADPEDQVALGDGALPLNNILASIPSDALVVLSLDRMAGNAETIWKAVERSHIWLDGHGIR